MLAIMSSSTSVPYHLFLFPRGSWTHVRRSKRCGTEVNMHGDVFTALIEERNDKGKDTFDLSDGAPEVNFPS